MKSRLYRLLSRFIDFDALIARAESRAPDFIVWHDEAARVPYLDRWWLIPRNPIFNVYLHHITHSDDDRALHDHPWSNLSIILRGGYDEILPMMQGYPAHWDFAGYTRTLSRRAGDAVLRLSPSWRHRLVVPPNSPGAWTLFITGPVIHRWGFYCRDHFVHWRDFTAKRDKGAVGRGCA